MRQKLSEETVESIHALTAEGRSAVGISKHLQINERTVRRYQKAAGNTKSEREKNPSAERVNSRFNRDSGELEVNSLTINTLEQALEVAEVDLDKWQVERYVINSWQVTLKDAAGKPISRTNYQIKVWLKPSAPNPIALGFEQFLEKVPEFKFKRVPRFTGASGYALEVALVDAHMGKMAWGKEVGRDYDLDIAVNDYMRACEMTLGWSQPFQPEKIFYVVGQDLMHIENYLGITPKGGNVLDVDNRLPKIAAKAFETVCKTIYLCRDIAPVEVVWIPGNHDLHASMWLTMMLAEHFRNDDHVTVDCSPMQRKARLWGNLLVGWTHEIVNRHNAWVNELAQCFKKEWAKARFMEWHYGHKHKKMQIKSFPIATEGGVMLRQLTALSPIDAWHFENLFTDAVPGGEAFVWHKQHGVVANFTAWSDPAASGSC